MKIPERVHIKSRQKDFNKCEMSLNHSSSALVNISKIKISLALVMSNFEATNLMYKEGIIC